MSTSAPTRPKRRLIFSGLWLMSALLIAGSPSLPNETVRVLDGRGQAVLEPAAWTVPILKFPAGNVLGDWPFWLFAAAGGLLLAVVGRQMLARDFPPAAAYVGVIGLAMTARPEHFFLAGVVVLSTWLVGREMRPAYKLTAALGFLFLSVLASLEFGFIACLLLMMIVPDLWKTTAWRGRILLVAGLLLLGGAVWPWSAFRETALRFVRWADVTFPESIFSESFSTLSRDQDWRMQLPILVFFAYCWAMMFWKRDRHGTDLLLLLFLTLLGFGNRRYLWIAGLALAMSFHVRVRSEISPRISRAVLLAGLVFGAARFLPQSGTYFDMVVGEVTPPRVQPAEWGIEGRVMLLDLSQSMDWQNAKSRSRFQLLIDDRWESFGGRYEDYAAVCRDVREIRADSYLRTDGAWGGYQRWLNEWSPTLLVVNSENLWDIRRLSLSPHWRLMGIDARRTIFGAADDPDNYPQSAKALAMLMHLEWPPLSPTPWYENVMAANSPEDLLKVSRVLNALRFPYAGLRLLSGREDLAARSQRIWCYAEIAHRVYRYSGHNSLLDQFRGVVGLRQLLAEPDGDSETRLRALSAMESLGLPHLANELAGQVLERQADASMTTEQRKRLETLHERTSAGPSSSTESSSGPWAFESAVRRALQEGDSARASEALSELAEPLKDYYGIFLAAPDSSPAEVYDELSEQLTQPNFPENRRGEALFYLGCLAIEVGNSQAAATAFRKSEVVAPQSTFHALREMYLQQLGDR